MNNEQYQGQGTYQTPNPGQQGGWQPPYPPRRSGQEKSGFLTFCFAFIPGAAQMYLGFFKRGLSLIGLFCLGWWLSNAIGSLWFLMAIVWMASFFDAFDLRGKLASGVVLEDNYIIPIKDSGAEQLLARRHSVLGWGLIALGVFAVYDSILSPLVRDLCQMYNLYWLGEAFDRIPSIVLIAVLIGLGVWLVRGPKEKSAAASEEDVHYYGAPSWLNSNDEQQ